MINPSPHNLLVNRKKTASARGRRADPHHLALVLEGGGMRGIVSVAMASAFEERGLLPAFDSIHGSSAGACGGAYFAAGQATLGTTVYYEDINNHNFINLVRPALGRPIMNLDFLIVHIMQHVKPLRIDRILSAPGLVSVVATDVKSGAERIFHTFRDKTHFFQVLKASICLPL